MSLLTYQQARPWAKAMKEAVLTRRMPPWFADPAHGEFANNRRLSTEEIDTIAGWVDGGAKEGDPRDAPRAMSFTEGWVIGNPDVVIEMPVAYEVPASGTVEYTYFVAPTGFIEDKWVQKVEVRPGSKAAVHHIILVVRPPGAGYLRDARPGVPYVPPGRNARPPSDDGQGVLTFAGGPTEIVGVYVPGGLPNELKAGQARLIPKGSDLVFQVHYIAGGHPASDRSRVGFIFAKQPPAERVLNTLVANPNLRIPPQVADYPVSARVTLYARARLLSLLPHMHARGKSFEYRAVLPTGETEILLAVPRYDVNWQLTYYLRQPKVLPKGTMLECVAHYDNSFNNPHNPDPRAEVTWGDQIFEEMLAGFMDLAVPVGTDPRDLSLPTKASGAP